MLTKLRLYSTLVLPVLLYASETWTTTKQDLARLQDFHMKSQRISWVCVGRTMLPTSLSKREHDCRTWETLSRLEGLCCPTTSDRPMKRNAGVEQGHIHESTCTGGSAEAQGLSTHFVDEPGEQGYRGTISYILATCGGSSIVEIRRYGPYRLCAIKNAYRTVSNR